MRFSLLGPLEVRDGEQAVSITAGKQRALLADLLLNANRAVPTARLIDDLWGEQVPDTAVKALQVHVSKLRKALPAGRLLTRGPGYLLEVGDGELDLHAFTRGLDEGRAALARGEGERASALLAAALTLWRGPALAEFDEPFARIEAARLEELHLTGVEERIEADLGVGLHTTLVAELESLVAAHPLRERLRAQLMLALYRSGRQAEALEAYQSYRAMLDDDLGIEPSPSLRELERRVLQHDPTLDRSRDVRDSITTTGSTQSATSPPDPVVPRAAATPSAAATRSRGQLVVGRDDDLRALQRLMSEAAAGERRLVFVSGEPGAGKTTLVNAFLAELDPAVRVGVGQCIESRGSGEAYHPMLEALARVARGDGGATLVRLLAERAPTWLLQLPWLVPEDERAETEARVLGTTRDRMLREIVEVLDAFTAEQPLVVVLEDLQWADYSTVDLVDVIARRFEPARLLILGTHRSEPGATDVNPLIELARTLRLRNLCTELALRPLDEAEIASYLAARLDGAGLGAELGAELATLIRARTRGNPLFVEKLVEAWLEEGWIVTGDEGWELARALDELSRSVPATLRMLMEQRCAATGPEVLELLEAAALVGSEFSVALAAHAAGTDEEVAERLLLDALSEGALIEAAGEAVWPDGTVSSVYAFVHDLCYEVLQGRLPVGRRVRLHRRIADRLEAAHRDQGEEIAAELAWHFLQAREPARAVRYLQGAAERALELNAPREALEHLGAARAALGAIPDRRARSDAELRVQQLIGRAALVTDGYSSPDAEQALVRARQLATVHGDVEQLAVASHGLATLYEIRGEYARSEEILAETLTLPGLATVSGPLVDTNELMACSLYHQGAFDRSLEHAEAALDAYDGVYANPLAAAFGEHPGVSCHLWAALSTWFLGFPDRALERAERAVAATTIGPRFRARAMAQAQASVIAYLRGDVATARDWAAAALATAAELGVGYWMSMAGVVHGWTTAVDGDATGLDEIREAIERSRAVGARMDEPFYLALLADAALRCGRLDEARGGRRRGDRAGARSGVLLRARASPPAGSAGGPQRARRSRRGRRSCTPAGVAVPRAPRPDHPRRAHRRHGRDRGARRAALALRRGRDHGGSRRRPRRPSAARRRARAASDAVGGHAAEGRAARVGAGSLRDQRRPQRRLSDHRWRAGRPAARARVRVPPGEGLGRPSARGLPRPARLVRTTDQVRQAGHRALRPRFAAARPGGAHGRPACRA